jgi:RimJ/RimL family protein N-acetyltransferase
LADGSHIGNCGFKNISVEKNSGELWIYIGKPSNRGKGIGLKATRALVEEGFLNLGLKQVVVHVADFNKAALNLYKKLGFVETPMTGDGSQWQARGLQIIRMELYRD